jgi:Short C-terminal domain
MTESQGGDIARALGEPFTPADEVAKLADLKAQGVIDDADYARLKAKAIAGADGTGTG